MFTIPSSIQFIIVLPKYTMTIAAMTRNFRVRCGPGWIHQRTSGVQETNLKYAMDMIGFVYNSFYIYRHVYYKPG
jgi:hypothetical protein